MMIAGESRRSHAADPAGGMNRGESAKRIEPKCSPILQKILISVQPVTFNAVKLSYAACTHVAPCMSRDDI